MWVRALRGWTSIMFKFLIWISLGLSFAYDIPKKVADRDVDQKQNPNSEFCDLGPAYWCTNLATANDCGALKYCVMNVWDIKSIVQDSAVQKKGKKTGQAAAAASSGDDDFIEGEDEEEREGGVSQTASPRTTSKKNTENIAAFPVSQSFIKNISKEVSPVNDVKRTPVKTSSTRTRESVGKNQTENISQTSPETNDSQESDSAIKRNWCSVRSTIRGPRQRVVSFSFFGNLTYARHYFQGIKANADMMPVFYPGWIMRVYHSSNEQDEYWPVLQELESRYPHLDLCNVNSLRLRDFEPVAWRYSAIADRQVDILVSRDLDAVFSHREAAAVAEWLNANLSFHVMRDHPRHLQSMNGGLWGVKRQVAPKYVQRLAKDLWKVARSHPSPAGMHLHLAFWDQLKGNVLQHDSYSCTSTFALIGHMRPWPTKREKGHCNFVGCSLKHENPVLKAVCPEACRPASHKEWEFC